MKPLTTIYFVVMLLVSVNYVFAHPPKDMELNYSTQDHLLKVKVLHFVKSPAKHYIDKITIALNGEEIISQKFKMQGSDGEQEVVYTIVDAKEGDKISVTAFCNISGKRQKTLDVISIEEIEPEEE